MVVRSDGHNIIFTTGEDVKTLQIVDELIYKREEGRGDFFQ